MEGPATSGGGGSGSTGILARAGPAAGAEGRPPGRFTMGAALREDPGADSRRWPVGPGRAQELAAACPDTRTISATGCEGGFREPLARAAADGAALSANGIRLGGADVSNAHQAPVMDGYTAVPCFHFQYMDCQGTRSA